MVTKINYVTLLDLSKMLKVKKSSLIYYVQMGILIPDMYAGKAALFEEKKILATWDRMQKLRKAGHSLANIRDLINENRTK